ncbi:MAG: ABC transporter ATP-binding protein [Acidobacteria bacterium]|nr:ABC transporter ATP-binding protein [Acidobacteriota bacterium]
MQNGTAPWRTLFHLALPYRRQFLLIALLALTATSLDLVEPLIYRAAVNDVAGLFVDQFNEPPPSDTDLLDDSSLPITTAPAASEPTQSPTPVPTPATTPSPTTARPSASPQHRLSHEERERRKRNHEKRRQIHEVKRLEQTVQPHRSDYIAPRTPKQTIRTLLWAVALLFLTGVGAYFFSLRADNLSTKLASHIEAELIRSTFGHVLRLPLEFFGKRASGGLAKQIDQSDQVAPIVTAFSLEIAPEAIRLIGVFVIMLTQSWRLTLIALVILPPYLWIARQSAKRLESGLSEYYEMWENVSARIQDGLAAIKTVKLSGAEPREEKRFQETSNAAYANYMRRARLGNRYLFLQVVLSHLSKAAVFAYGGWMVLERQLTPGDVVMFVAYLDRLYDPIDSLSSMAVNLQQNIASLNRAIRLMKTGSEEESGKQLQPGAGRVEFRDVHFGYTPEREVLRGLSFALAPGKVTAVVGTSGAGKTTTADLLLKLYKPQSGEILIDGQPLSELDPSSVRAAIGVVAADGAIFRGTLADNIRYKCLWASDEEVKAAALAAGLGAALERLPEGLDTEIGERGMGLSVGERQRLQIARILASEPRILVMDEATANLDYATELEVKQALAHLRNKPTMMVIAHRYSMVKDADHVIVLDAGQVIEEGAPDELIAAGGWFAQLAQGNEEERNGEEADDETGANEEGGEEDES